MLLHSIHTFSYLYLCRFRLFINFDANNYLSDSINFIILGMLPDNENNLYLLVIIGSHLYKFYNFAKAYLPETDLSI